ncbi:hypothetical protein J2Z19_002628 [Ensifer adhaerens]|uniref:Uncharacterized protein n=1 Tax=Ensifer adhaerens TaxID=106592 RepID=A0ACC5SVL8_ENSAD|nr:hypothetical protein [Ensifer adhaerens]
MPKKLPARYNAIAMPLVLSVLMSCLVSAVSTVASVGASADLFALWMKAWGHLVARGVSEPAARIAAGAHDRWRAGASAASPALNR